MLILTRRPGQVITLGLQDWVSPNLTVQELFTDGDIQIAVRRILRNEVRLGIEAPAGVRVLREELLPREERLLLNKRKSKRTGQREE